MKIPFLLVLLWLASTSSAFAATTTLSQQDQLDKAASAYANYDVDTALNIWRELATAGNVEAQVRLGNAYADGKTPSQDDAEAVRWLRLAAALRWLTKTAEQGRDQAQNTLGTMYASGRGVPQDYTIAERWWRQSAEQGNKTALRNLGVLRTRVNRTSQAD